MVVLRRGVNHEAASQTRLIGHSRCRRESKIAARTVPGQYNLTIIGSQRVEVVDNPTRRLHGVVMSGGKRMFWCKAIGYGH